MCIFSIYLFVCFICIYLSKNCIGKTTEQNRLYILSPISNINLHKTRVFSSSILFLRIVPLNVFSYLLGEHKIHFIPALIGPFLEVTLIPQPDLRNVVIPIFHDMMDWEQRRSGNFKQVFLSIL